MSNVREVTEGLQLVGEDERPVFSLTTTAAGGSPTSVSVVAKLEEDWTDITSTIFPTNSPSVASDVITLSAFTPSTTYREKVIRVEVKFTSAGSILEHYFRCLIER